MSYAPQTKGNTTGFALDPNIDSEEDVLKIRKAAMCAAAEGLEIMKWAGNGTEVEKQRVWNVAEVLAETRTFLKRVNPQAYGAIVRQSTVVRMG